MKTIQIVVDYPADLNDPLLKKVIKLFFDDGYLVEIYDDAVNYSAPPVYSSGVPKFKAGDIVLPRIRNNDDEHVHAIGLIDPIGDAYDKHQDDIDKSSIEPTEDELNELYSDRAIIDKEIQDEMSDRNNDYYSDDNKLQIP